jgi:hypothetical protein
MIVIKSANDLYKFVESIYRRKIPTSIDLFNKAEFSELLKNVKQYVFTDDTFSFDILKYLFLCHGVSSKIFQSAYRCYPVIENRDNINMYNFYHELIDWLCHDTNKKNVNCLSVVLYSYSYELILYTLNKRVCSLDGAVKTTIDVVNFVLSSVYFSRCNKIYKTLNGTFNEILKLLTEFDCIITENDVIHSLIVKHCLIYIDIIKFDIPLTKNIIKECNKLNFYPYGLECKDIIDENNQLEELFLHKGNMILINKYMKNHKVVPTKKCLANACSTGDKKYVSFLCEICKLIPDGECLYNIINCQSRECILTIMMYMKFDPQFCDVKKTKMLVLFDFMSKKNKRYNPIEIVTKYIDKHKLQKEDNSIVVNEQMKMVFEKEKYTNIDELYEEVKKILNLPK